MNCVEKYNYSISNMSEMIDAGTTIYCTETLYSITDVVIIMFYAMIILTIIAYILKRYQDGA